MRISVRDIQKQIAADFGIEPEKMSEPRPVGDCQRNARPVSHARQFAMLLSRELTPLSLPVLGKLFGGRDHTTIIHGVNEAKRRISTDRNLALKIEARALLLTSEPQKAVHGGFIGFPSKSEGACPHVIHSPPLHRALAAPQAQAA